MLRQVGCGLLIIVWFGIVLLPCLMITLAIRGEITVPYSDIPEDEFKLWSIQSADARGIGIANSRRVPGKNGETCTIIQRNFIMWQGEASAARWCSCYTKKDSRWGSVAEAEAACKLAGE